MSSRICIREKVQKLFEARNDTGSLVGGISSKELKYVDVDARSSGSLSNSSSIQEPESEEPPFQNSLPDGSRAQHFVDLDASIASSMSNLDASLTSIPETELVRLPAKCATLSWGSVSERSGGVTVGVDRKSSEAASWSTSGVGGNGETGSFDSTVTDFDYLTSPGAQAERNAEYQQALHQAQLTCGGFPDHRMLAGVAVQGAQPAGSFPSILGTSWFGHPQGALPMFGFGNGSMQSQRSQPLVPVGAGQAVNGADLKLRAKELDVYATQLMAQAMQAKAEVLRMQSGVEPAAPMQPVPNPASGQRAETESEPPLVMSMLESERTTIMLRNLPNDYTRAMVLELLDENGFACCYNFLYVPMDYTRKVGLGYAFVNLTEHLDAQRAFKELRGFSDWKVLGSSKVLEVAWGNPLQGLKAHVDRYQNSPMMHPEVLEEFRPLLFKDGVRIDFPAPTQKLRAPRTR